MNRFDAPEPLKIDTEIAKCELKAFLQDSGISLIYPEPVNLKNAGASDYYVDVKMAYGYPRLLRSIATGIYSMMDETCTCVASSGYGGVPLASAICSDKELKSCLIRDKPKGHGKGGMIDGYLPCDKDNVSIVDDVFTTGGSLRKMVEIIENTGAGISGCFVVVKRGEGDLSDIGVPLKYLFMTEELL